MPRRPARLLAGLLALRNPGTRIQKDAFWQRGRRQFAMASGFADAQRDAQDWRRLEAEARIVASTMSDAKPKWIMLSIAEAYKRLADFAELRGARQLIDTAPFGPQSLKVIGEAFDAAWAQIARNFSGTRTETEVARVKLATALLSIAPHVSRDVDVLAKLALQKMALRYRSL